MGGRKGSRERGKSIGAAREKETIIRVLKRIQGGNEMPPVSVLKSLPCI